ncbi:homoserine O-acetyltransferase family protein [Algoriphagus taiwanensis]|uniref:Homoserine O-acetyltransferase n=1 Tax=Algoriphagus taiwanensis TaxID=1445656 RepID=A0ABQ6PYI1_9BACT|nr:homoserine O-acetyltransferase [Algoriphagus taiwanensis]
MDLLLTSEDLTMIDYTFHSDEPLVLESGQVIRSFDLAYTTYGKLNENKSNVVWVVHALTGNSHAAEWWEGLIGEGKFFDPSSHFIICVNLLGSNYGSTNPLSTNLETGNAYYYDFPQVTPRDLAASLERLRKYLQFDKIHTLIGGSLGGQVALEWAVALGEKLENVVILASTAKTSPWVIGFNEAQRMAIESDPTWGSLIPEAGKKGLEAARAIAMLSYRHPDDLKKKQTDAEEKLNGFRAASYLRYQGQKLANRFNALSYWILTKAMDSQDLGRGRGGVEAALQSIKARVLAVGVNTDLLFLPEESQFIAQKSQRGQYQEINSTAGHDAFLIEFGQLSEILASFYKQSEKA